MMRLSASVPPVLTPAGGDVSQDLVSPLSKGSAEAGGLGDGARVQGVDQRLREPVHDLKEPDSAA
jgi:hypothetical protein